MTKEQFTAMLLESITCVLREKKAAGKIVIASVDTGGLERLALELANNAAAAPWLELELEREATEATLAACDEWRQDTIEELRNVDAVLERADIPLHIDGDDEPLELATRVGMLASRVLHAEPAAPAVVRGPIALKTCVCTTAVFTCSNCNGLPKEQGDGTEA